MEPENNNTVNQNNAATGKGSWGALIGIIVIVAILLLGAFYFSGSTPAAVEEVPASGEALSEGNEPADIEEDLNASDVSALEGEVDGLSAELEASIGE